VIDPGRLFAEAIYFIQYAFAQILWAINRAAISIAIIAESINSWLTENVGYLVELLVNALSAPLGGMFILALTALGFWYLLNNVVPTNRWVDPSKLFFYGLIAFFFFSSPIIVIGMMEDVRISLNAGIDQALLDGASGNIFDSGMDGTDAGLPDAIPDVNSDGVIGSFDLAAAFMLVANIDELDSSEFPVDFEATYFPFGDPSSLNLSDEADQELAKALANDGIERLFFSLVAIPTAVAEHFLRLALTSVAMFLYTGVPIAMVFAFFIYTQAFLGAYLRQFINLLIETLMSVIITAIMLGLLVAAAQQGIGLYIGASFLVCIVLLWRIKSALKLASAAIDLFGGSTITGGAGGMALAKTGADVVGGTLALAGAAVTGGAALAVGGAAMTAAAALRADQQTDGLYTGLDASKADGRVRQLKTIAGYALGQSEPVRKVIEGAHEMRTFGRNFLDGEVQTHDPDTLDYFRAGAAMSGYGSSPWMAMRTSPSLRAAFDQIGGTRNSNRDAAFEGDGELVNLPGTADHLTPGTNGSSGRSQSGGRSSDAAAPQPPAGRAAPATPQQLAYLRFLQVELPDSLTRGQASDLIEQAKGSGDQTTALPPNKRRRTPLKSRMPPVNGPIPEWLQDDPPLGMVGDLFPMGEPEYIDDGRSSATVSAPAIRLAPHSEARQQQFQAIVARLSAPDTPAGKVAQQTLLFQAGPQNSALLSSAVNQHTAEAVQQAVTAAAAQLAAYRAEGLNDAEIFSAFQGGTALEVIREQSNTPLSDPQLTAVADMVLLPQRRLTRGELAQAIGQVAMANQTANEQDVVAAIGSAVGFGGQTGTIRGVLAGARELRLSPADLARLVEMIQAGLQGKAQAELTSSGYRPERVRELLGDLAALPGSLVVPQTTTKLPAVLSPSEDDAAEI